MRTFAIVNRKGGVGKTTTAVNLAYVLATSCHLRVLLVDADGQANATQILLPRGEYAGLGALLRGCAACYNELTVHTDVDGLDVLPASEDLWALDLEAKDSCRYSALMQMRDAVEEDGTYTNPKVLECCNPGWGQSIRPQEMINDAMQAKEDPQLRPEFLQKSLNVFIASLRAWFDIEEFRASDSKYSWTLKELARLPIHWYGGSDLSKLYDLTAAAMFGHYNGVDIIIPHCWFPLAAATVKAHEDNIPLFGWKEDGWLDMSNDKTTNHSDVVRW